MTIASHLMGRFLSSHDHTRRRARGSPFSLAWSLRRRCRAQLLLFDSARVLGAGQIWRLATYAFVHSPSMLLWFAIEMYMLFVFGREVERFIGQRAYIALYALLLLVPSLVLTVWGLGQRTGLAGSLALHFGIFVAFAAIYPAAELLLRITANNRSFGRSMSCKVDNA